MPHLNIALDHDIGYVGIQGVYIAPGKNKQLLISRFSTNVTAQLFSTFLYVNTSIWILFTPYTQTPSHFLVVQADLIFLKLFARHIPTSTKQA